MAIDAVGKALQLLSVVEVMDLGRPQHLGTNDPQQPLQRRVVVERLCGRSRVQFVDDALQHAVGLFHTFSPCDG